MNTAGTARNERKRRKQGENTNAQSQNTTGQERCKLERRDREEALTALRDDVGTKGRHTGEAGA